MNGVLLVNKPSNYTSRDIVNIVGKMLGTKKVGHTGTLDPMATGVLVLCIGNYTKLVDIITCTNKEYIAEITLGTDTDTLDITGNVINDIDAIYNKEAIIKVLKEFNGKYMQEVPIYSAIKIKGMKLYDYARACKSVELPKREVEIKEIELLDVRYDNNKTIFSIKTLVSKGTYIRSLARDIALKLNTVGCMSKLTRTMQGKFSISSCCSLDDIKESKYKLLNLDDILDYKIIDVDDKLDKLVRNGCPIDNIYKEEYIIFKGNNLLVIYKDNNGILKSYVKLK